MATPRMRISFEPTEHRYQLEGTDVPSVTQVFSAEGLAGSPFYKESDRRRGSAVHKIALLLTKRPWRGSTVEEIVANSAWDPERTDPILVPYGMAAAAYLLESGFRPELVETTAGSRLHGICGTPDAWGPMPSGLRTLVDYKSGQPEEAANLQTALYALMLEECYGLQTDQRVVVWLKSDGSYKAFPPRPPGGTDLAIALSAVNLYKWRKRFNKLG